ncbi:MAG: hypothetical protein PHC69_04415 [Ruminiclostridium sp.]|nr:hypothetical protein [Ruminiclostridium sp.]
MILNEAIQIMTSNIVTVLADNKPVIYLFGSVALDDFQLGWSDMMVKWSIYFPTILGHLQIRNFTKLFLLLLISEG